MNDEKLNKMLDIMVETRDKLESVDRLATEVSGVNTRLDRIERIVDGHTGRLDRIETDIKELKSELGTVKDAVLDIGRTVKGHDLDIRELKERIA